ncbi:transporter substrate-binding domain-containing protein [Brenneria corticis]|uniref:Amino acid ABC transporter substrate-binding protein n=1 Tax=Brenneria corticis TaxID=2173106 RepID=A0A2U1U5G0_9GAMM|nr:transporter substrate-binding domain-containing protein [Brenneria sp. CFCC 11842]PWC16900.1 amino acid ABC transporter substrate-binding protein [Brenneria sp. CFCC 11842]
MKRQTLLSALVGVVAAFAVMTANAAGVLDNIMSQKNLRVAVPVDYPPYGYVGSDMQPQGVDIDVARLIGEKMGVKVTLIPVTGPNRVPYLQTGKADMTISSLGKTEERAKVIDYSIAYAPFFDAVFGGGKVKATTTDELAGKTVAVTRGSMQDEELTTMAPKAVIRRFEDNNSTISAFLSGQTELVAIGTTVAGAMKQKNPRLDLELKVILSNSPCYVGMPKDQPDLVARVNQILRAAKADGTLDAIAQKWLGAPAGDLPE